MGWSFTGLGRRVREADMNLNYFPKDLDLTGIIRYTDEVLQEKGVTTSSLTSSDANWRDEYLREPILSNNLKSI